MSSAGIAQGLSVPSIESQKVHVSTVQPTDKTPQKWLAAPKQVPAMSNTEKVSRENIDMTCTGMVKCVKFKACLTKDCADQKQVSQMFAFKSPRSKTNFGPVAAVNKPVPPVVPTPPTTPVSRVGKRLMWVPPKSPFPWTGVSCNLPTGCSSEGAQSSACGVNGWDGITHNGTEITADVEGWKFQTEHFIKSGGELGSAKCEWVDDPNPSKCDIVEVVNEQFAKDKTCQFTNSKNECDIKIKLENYKLHSEKIKVKGPKETMEDAYSTSINYCMEGDFTCVNPGAMLFAPPLQILSIEASVVTVENPETEICKVNDTFRLGVSYNPKLRIDSNTREMKGLLVQSSKGQLSAELAPDTENGFSLKFVPNQKCQIPVGQTGKVILKNLRFEQGANYFDLKAIELSNNKDLSSTQKYLESVKLLTERMFTCPQEFPNLLDFSRW